MNRTRWLIVTIAVLLAAHVGWRVWQGWGLITIHSENWPVSKIIREIEKQGNVTVKSNLDPSSTARMHVDRVPVGEALESLAAATDSGWRLAYIYGPDKGKVNAAVSAYSAGESPEGWRTVFVPLGGGDMEFDPPSDPRRDVWNVHPPEERKLHAYLEQGAQSVAAAFAFPDSWNPDVSKEFKAGRVGKVAASIASAAGGAVQEVFLLTRNRSREDRPDRTTDDPDAERRREWFRNAMTARVEAEIEKLPPADREQAKAEVAERRQFFEGMRDLSPDERRARMQEFMEDPRRQEKMALRDAERAARMTPEQRMERAKNYLSRKRQAKAQN